MTSSPPVKSVNVCGAGHSGSTLLGLLLGCHPACFYAGECAKVRYLGDASKPARKRICKLCGADCRIWSTFRWEADAPLYACIAAHVGREIVVDTTKNVGWIQQRLEETAAAGGEPILLFLTRDGRAVINSRLRKYPDRDAEEQIRAWMAQIESSEALYRSFTGPKMRLRYEALATAPESTAERLCVLLEIPYEPAMVEFQRADHHPLGGNNGTQYLVARARFEDPADAFVSLGERSRDYYERHDDSIRLDLRWKDEMRPEHLDLFERVVGSFNEPLAWEA